MIKLNYINIKSYLSFNHLSFFKPNAAPLKLFKCHIFFSQNDDLLSDMKSTMCAHREVKKVAFWKSLRMCFTPLPKVQVKLTKI